MLHLKNIKINIHRQDSYVCAYVVGKCIKYMWKKYNQIINIFTQNSVGAY